MTSIEEGLCGFFKLNNYELELNEPESEEQVAVDTTPLQQDPGTPGRRRNRDPVDCKDYKDALLASLYSQVDFLRKQLEDQSTLNRNLVQCIMSMSGIGGVPNSNAAPATDDRRSSSESSYESCEEEREYDHNESQHLQQQQQQQQQQQRRQQQQQQQQRNIPSYGDQMSDYVKKKQAEHAKRKEDETGISNGDHFASWEKHSTKYGSKVMSKWGYNGGGLGKDGKGITSPIKAKSSSLPLADNTVWPEGTTLIIGDSMLNGIKEDRLKRYKAKVEACPGATVKDMYGAITPLLAKKPSKVIMHVGTNDSPYKPSQTIVSELVVLRKFIESNLPGAKVILSSPIMRTDNKLANSTIRAVNNSLKSLPNVIHNDKLDAHCLGKKGRNLNRKGTGKLAVNFISEMQRV